MRDFDSGNLFHAWQKLIITDKPDAILRKLEKLIQDGGGMFRDDPAFKEFRSLSLQFRVSLLLELGRYAKALAWLCLETEVNPANFEGQA
jgi:hypothetical protein